MPGEHYEKVIWTMLRLVWEGVLQKHIKLKFYKELKEYYYEVYGFREVDHVPYKRVCDEVDRMDAEK